MLSCGMVIVLKETTEINGGPRGLIFPYLGQDNHLPQLGPLFFWK